MLVKDAMVLIHLAKMTLLTSSCDVFGPVMIPPQVRDEVSRGEQRGYADAEVVRGAIDTGHIRVESVDDPADLEWLQRLNVTGGEAEAVALCWQEGIQRLATDDDNVRGKQALLNVQCVGTPAILLALFKRGQIAWQKLEQAVETLAQIGWFSRPVLDKVLMEAQRWEAR